MFVRVLPFCFALLLSRVERMADTPCNALLLADGAEFSDLAAEYSLLGAIDELTGGPRDQQQRFQDAVAVVRKYGPPSFFVTMSCNPKWPEILDAIERNQSASDRCV